MSYATHSDVQQRMGSVAYVQLTDDAGTGAADEAKVTEARSAAESEVNSYLGRRYAVPINVAAHAELQSLLRSVTLDLVEYRLHSRRPPVPADVAVKRTAGIDWLQQVAVGKAVLPSLTELAGRASEGVVAEVSGSSRVWSREEAEGL